MRIIKSKEEIDKFKENKKIANEGCDICPGCGGSEQFCVTNQGITGIQTHKRDWTQGIFNKRYLRVDRYHCWTCGCVWESEPYEWK